MAVRGVSLLCIEKLAAAWTVATTLLVVALWSHLPEAAAMLQTRLVWCVATAAAVAIDHRWSGLWSELLRCAVQLAWLSVWYPETYELNRWRENLDWWFAEAEWGVFGCQPSLEMCRLLPGAVWSELFNLGYFSYFPMIAVLIFGLAWVVGPGGETPGTAAGPGGETPGTEAGPGGEAAGTVAGPGGEAAGTVAGPGGEAAGTAAGPGGKAEGTVAGPGGKAAGTVAGEGLVTRVAGVVLLSFFVYYVIYIALPVTGPQFYFAAIGTDSAAAGIYPHVGTYFNTHTAMLPSPGWSDGLFHRLVEWTHETGERPTAAFPSSHVGCSTIVFILAWRHVRQVVPVLFPLWVLLCGATVYIQAHYVIDAVAGLLSAPLVLWLSRRCVAAMSGGVA